MPSAWAASSTLTRSWSTKEPPGTARPWGAAVSFSWARMEAERAPDPEERPLARATKKRNAGASIYAVRMADWGPKAWRAAVVNRGRNTAASPDAWRSVAVLLRRSAEILRERVEAATAEIRADGAAAQQPPLEAGLWSIQLMLMGFALENLIKATIIAREPHLVQAHHLERLGHDLPRLFQRGQVAVSDRERELLQRLTKFAVWSGRYPVPIEFSNFAIPRQRPKGIHIEIQKGAHDEDLFAGIFDRLCAPVVAHADDVGDRATRH